MQTILFEKTIDAEGRVTVTYEKGVSIFTTLLKRTTPPMPPGILTATLVPAYDGDLTILKAASRYTPGVKDEVK